MVCGAPQGPWTLPAACVRQAKNCEPRCIRRTSTFDRWQTSLCIGHRCLRRGLEEGLHTNSHKFCCARSFQ